MEDGKKHQGNAKEALGHVVEGQPKPHSIGIFSTALAQVNVSALHSRLCGPVRSAGAPEPVWWTKCCAEGAGGLGALLAGASAPVVVKEDALPTFACTAADERQDFLPVAVTVPCSRAEDDFCDCSGDGADEYFSSACAAVRDTYFYCASGALTLVEGELARMPLKEPSSYYISSTKVGDGVKDCIGGEDEEAAALAG